MRGAMREKSSAVWELRVEMGRDPVTGRRRQLSRSFRGTKKAAQNELNNLLADVSRGTQTGTSARVADLLERWLDMAEADLSPTTARRYRGLIKVHVLPAMGNRPLHNVTTADLDEFYLGLVRQKNLAPASVRQVHALLRRALGQAERWGWIAKNPAVNASPPRVRRTPITPPSPTDLLRLIQMAEDKDPEFGCFLRLSAASGARRGEMCALRWSHIDFDSQSVVIERSIIEVAGGLLEKDTKTHAARRISLDAGTLNALQAHRGQMEERAEVAETPLSEDGFLFSLEPDCSRPWAPDRVTKMFVTLRNQAGLDQVRLHDLRHFAATRLLAAGVPVRTVSGRLGHANAATTLGVYAHFLSASDQVAAEVLGDLLARRPAAASA